MGDNMNKINDFDSKAVDSKIIDEGMNLSFYDGTLIKLFNLFLSSNPNYLYNKTYILDLLDKFKNNIDILKKKREVSKKLLNSFEALTFVNELCFAVIDDYFILTTFTKEEVLSYSQLYELIENSSETIYYLELNSIKGSINKFVNCNNLYDIKKNKYNIRFFYSDFNRLFSCALEGDKEKDKENISGVLKEIQFFINESNEIIERRTNKNGEK